MELQQLQHFLVLAQTRSFVQAAEALAITPSGLSRSIRTLEDFLGVELFTRHSRGATLSPFGEVLLPHAEHILQERARAIGEIDALKASRGGRIRAAIHPVFDALVAREVIDPFSIRFPDVELDLWSGTDPELSRRELALDFDFGFTFFPAQRDETVLAYEPLFEVPVSICTGGNGDPLQMSGSELLEAEWVLLGADAFRRMFDGIFRARAVAPPRRMRLCSSLSVLSTLIRDGRRLTLLPRLKDDALGIELRAIESDIAPLPVAGGLVYRRDAAHAPACLALIEAFRERIRLLPA